MQNRRRVLRRPASEYARCASARTASGAALVQAMGEADGARTGEAGRIGKKNRSAVFRPWAAIRRMAMRQASAGTGEQEAAAAIREAWPFPSSAAVAAACIIPFVITLCNAQAGEQKAHAGLAGRHAAKQHPLRGPGRQGTQRPCGRACARAETARQGEAVSSFHALSADALAGTRRRTLRAYRPATRRVDSTSATGWAQASPCAPSRSSSRNSAGI